MVIMLNFTGLDRVYWRPAIERQSDRDGLWYVDIKWLGVEATIYGREMGCAVIRLFGARVDALDEYVRGEGE